MQHKQANQQAQKRKPKPKKMKVEPPDRDPPAPTTPRWRKPASRDAAAISRIDPAPAPAAGSSKPAAPVATSPGRDSKAKRPRGGPEADDIAAESSAADDPMRRKSKPASKWQPSDDEDAAEDDEVEAMSDSSAPFSTPSNAGKLQKGAARRKVARWAATSDDEDQPAPSAMAKKPMRAAVEEEEEEDANAPAKKASGSKRGRETLKQPANAGDGQKSSKAGAKGKGKIHFPIAKTKANKATSRKVPKAKKTAYEVTQKLPRAIQYRGLDLPGDPGQRSTTEALAAARGKRIRFVQLGGGLGSSGGDSGLASLLNSRRRAAIDLGSGKAQSGALTRELKAIKANDPRNDSESEAETATEDEDSDQEVPKEAQAESGSEEMLVQEAKQQKSKQLVIITHWHKDHAGDPDTLWQTASAEQKKKGAAPSASKGATKKTRLPTNIAALIASKGATKRSPQPRLAYGQRPPTAKYQPLADRMKPHLNVRKNGKQLFAWRTRMGKNRADRPKEGELLVEGRAIRPPDMDDPTMEDPEAEAKNEESLGVVTTIDKYTGLNKKERLFTMVSLGDMEGGTKEKEEAVAGAIREVVGLDKETETMPFPADVVKISHHGSENNLGIVPGGLIGPDTVVVISGYTKTKPVDLINKIDSWKAKRVVLLIQDAQTLAKLKAEMSMSWAPLKAKVAVANNLVMSVDDDGSVNIEATTFG